MPATRRWSASRLAVLVVATLALLVSSCNKPEDTTGPSGNWDALIWDQGNWQ